MATAVRWVARVLGTLIVLLFVFLTAVQGIPSPSSLTPAERLLFVAVIVMLVGLVSAWKWELAGGLLTICGYVLFAIVEQEILLPWVFSLILITGVLFLLSWFLKRRSCPAVMK